MVGAGLVGLATAWLLLRRGHAVTVVDPAAKLGPQVPGAGSSAALGVLMGDVFRRSSGRGWRLRQRSLALWAEWRRILADAGSPVSFRPGLLLLASGDQEWRRLEALAHRRQSQGIPIELLVRQELSLWSPALPAAALGGLFSARDGQLDPCAARDALRRDGVRRGVRLVDAPAPALERAGRGWRIPLREGGSCLEADWVVVAAGLGSTALLEPLGHIRPLEPVLGQALELEVAAEATSPPLLEWPGAVVWQGWNLVPRERGPGGRRFWLGATLEPGSAADPGACEELLRLGGGAPVWLETARIVRHWQGLRARPLARPAPLLEELEPGLLLASGHYRNGVLLAPASAEWAAERIAVCAPGP